METYLIWIFFYYGFKYFFIFIFNNKKNWNS